MGATAIHVQEREREGARVWERERERWRDREGGSDRERLHQQKQDMYTIKNKICLHGSTNISSCVVLVFTYVRIPSYSFIDPHAMRAERHCAVPGFVFLRISI